MWTSRIIQTLKGWWLYQYTSWENFKIGFILVHNAAIKALHDMKKSLMIIVQFFVFLFLLTLHISVLFLLTLYLKLIRLTNGIESSPSMTWFYLKLRFYGNFNYLFGHYRSLFVWCYLLHILFNEFKDE